MNTRSIKFRLTAWYAGLLFVAALAFGSYTYERLSHYLSNDLIQSLASRASRIGTSLVADIQTTGEQYVINEIKARYAPELNGRFIRVLRPNSSILYVSGIPNDNSFDPKDVPIIPGATAEQTTREEVTASGVKLMVVSDPCFVGHQRYIIETGGSEAGMHAVLIGFTRTLFFGLPLFAGIAIFGGYLLVKWALSPVQKIMGAAQEITLHHLDKRLPVVETGDEIERLSNTLNRMVSRLEKSFRHNSRFTADASHELRTPLTIMRGELETLLMDRSLPQDVSEMLGSLFEETERLSRIVEGLLALSRLDAGETRMNRDRFDLAALAATTAEQMCLLAEEKNIALACETHEPVEVEGDQSKLKQVVVNLLDNAIKYTPEGGKIRLTVDERHGMARLSIADTGPGIPPAALPHVFERFFRADEVRSREVEGIGLGLSIVQSICTAHGGSINAENLPEGGCRFTVDIPLSDKHSKMTHA
jgi:heavy metal sensor kinase